LDRELQTITDIMANDIERAGYWKNANTGSNNPFMQTGTTDIAINAAQNCILFTYDSNGDGSLPAISVAYDDERYGYRLDDGAIQFRPYGAAFDCAAAHNNWTDLTRPSEMTITAFIVALNNKAVDIDGSGPGTNTIHYRTITMTISGQLTSDSNVKKTITRTIKVYNNKYVP